MAEELTFANIVKVPLIPASRLSVYNADVDTLEIGEAVKLEATSTITGIPDVKRTTTALDVFLGIMYEPVEAGKVGLCVVGQEIVELTVTAAVTQGKFAMLSAANPGEVCDLVAEAGNTIVGMFILGAAAGEECRMLILHGTDGEVT